MLWNLHLAKSRRVVFQMNDYWIYSKCPHCGNENVWQTGLQVPKLKTCTRCKCEFNFKQNLTGKQELVKYEAKEVKCRPSI